MGGFTAGPLERSTIMTVCDSHGSRFAVVPHERADAVMMGGIEEHGEITDDMEFVMSSVPDGEVEMDVASNSKGAELLLSVKPVCMNFEDYYTRFTDGSHPKLQRGSVHGEDGSEGEESTELEVRWEVERRPTFHRGM